MPLDGQPPRLTRRQAAELAFAKIEAFFATPAGKAAQQRQNNLECQQHEDRMVRAYGAQTERVWP